MSDNTSSTPTTEQGVTRAIAPVDGLIEGLFGTTAPEAEPEDNGEADSAHELVFGTKPEKKSKVEAKPAENVQKTAEKGAPDADPIPDDAWYAIEIDGKKHDLRELTKGRTARTVKAGREVDVPLSDLLSDQGIRNHYKYGTAEREAAQLKQQQGAIRDAIAKNDITKLGELAGASLDIKALVEAEIDRAIEEQTLTPEQRRIKELERREEQREAEAKAKAADAEAREFQQGIAEKARFAEAVLNHFKVPIDDNETEQVMYYLIDAEREGVSPAEAAHLWYKERGERLDSHLSTLSAEHLIKRLPKETQKAIAKAYAESIQGTKRIKAAPADDGSGIPPEAAAPRAPRKGRPAEYSREWWEERMKKLSAF
jgi:hypothetical protein